MSVVTNSVTISSKGFSLVGWYRVRYVVNKKATPSDFSIKTTEGLPSICQYITFSICRDIKSLYFCAPGARVADPCRIQLDHPAVNPWKSNVIGALITLIGSERKVHHGGLKISVFHLKAQPRLGPEPWGGMISGPIHGQEAHSQYNRLAHEPRIFITIVKPRMLHA